MNLFATLVRVGVPPTNAEDVTGPYPTVVRPNNNEIVLIVQTINYGKYLGLLQLTFDDDGKITNYEGNPVLLDSSVEQGMTSQIIE